jgi:hypothetical protein
MTIKLTRFAGSSNDEGGLTLRYDVEVDGLHAWRFTCKVRHPEHEPHIEAKLFKGDGKLKHPLSPHRMYRADEAKSKHPDYPRARRFAKALAKQALLGWTEALVADRARILVGLFEHASALHTREQEELLQFACGQNNAYQAWLQVTDSSERGPSARVMRDEALLLRTQKAEVWEALYEQRATMRQTLKVLGVWSPYRRESWAEYALEALLGAEADAVAVDAEGNRS